VKRSVRSRLDEYLVQHGLAPDVKEAQAMILAGEVEVDGHASTAGTFITDPSGITLKQKAQFVSRAGEKLAGALASFGISPNGKVCWDVGASTGGFTDCLIQSGAEAVVAIDVGHGLLDAKLRNHPKVRVLEETNFRQLELKDVPRKPGLIVADVSFISLSKLFPKMQEALEPGGDIVVLVKPQFEGTPREVPGGKVRDEATRMSILDRVRADAGRCGLLFKSAFDSTVTGRNKKNQETFFHLLKP
jgi:23S rRNA (cytidine1920-2'-O)/16S rRNA (cytidine1409-2'-O)-methyltransferase